MKDEKKIEKEDMEEQEINEEEINEKEAEEPEEDSCEDTIKQLEETLTQYKDKMQRMQADFENYKKRSEKEK